MTSMTIEFENGVAGMQVSAAGEYGSFYCDIIGSAGRARVGIYTPPFACNQKGTPIDLAQYNMPDNASPFKVAYEQIAAHLDGGPLPACTNKDWVAVNEIGFAAVESILTNRRVTLPNVNRSNEK